MRILSDAFHTFPDDCAIIEEYTSFGIWDTRIFPLKSVMFDHRNDRTIARKEANLTNLNASFIQK
jgi:hypothetical protein